VPGTDGQGQTFLVGDELYLRPVEKEDAGCASSWRDVPFPLSRAQVETWIAEEMVKDRDTQWLAIVRRADDRVVGSVRTHDRRGAAGLDIRVDPLFGPRVNAWKREALGLVVPWLTDERGIRRVQLAIDGDDAALIAAAGELGMRQVARLREQIDRAGRRVDRLLFEAHNWQWLAVLGDPLAEALLRTGTGQPRPVPAPVRLEGDPPRGAMLVGSRVYLRPVERRDLDEFALWSRRETETAFLLGRSLDSVPEMTADLTEAEKAALPTDWVMFAVCRREDDTFIGGVDLFRIDYQNRWAETGSFFHRPQDRGLGFGSEAKHLLLEYAFDRLGLHMLQSRVLFTNTRSAAALRKQGYRDAGRSTWDGPAHGGMVNVAFFDLLASEWRELPRAG
jgi:prepilin-type processing-associated H-X9-DG protein